MNKPEIAVAILIGAVLVTGVILVINAANKDVQADREKNRLATVATVEEGKNIVRQEAVTVGVARWTSDEKGKPKFEWITPLEKK